MLNSEFNEWGDASVDLYPRLLRSTRSTTASIRRSRTRLSLRVREVATGLRRRVAPLFDTLDYLEELLGRQRYLCGERITEADWRLYVTLVRFDAAYYGNFKCNRNHIFEYHNVSNYLRELYQWPGIAEITDIQGIKHGYYAIRDVNPTGIVPLGPHERGRLRASV
jgi:glutathionyl-hydroquinone reductase